MQTISQGKAYTYSSPWQWYKHHPLITMVTGQRYNGNKPVVWAKFCTAWLTHFIAQTLFILSWQTRSKIDTLTSSLISLRITPPDWQYRGFRSRTENKIIFVFATTTESAFTKIISQVFKIFATMTRGAKIAKAKCFTNKLLSTLNDKLPASCGYTSKATP